MPTGTPVDRIFQALKRTGMGVGKAARIAQAKSGLALSTGKSPKAKMKRKRRRAAWDR